MDEKQYRVKKIFDDISRRYDIFNRIATFFCDNYWRDQVVKQIDEFDEKKILDLCTGTGDIAIKIAQKNKNNINIIGLDFSANMLECANRKINKYELEHYIKLILANVNRLPFKDEQLDYITVGFSVRNFSDINRDLKEMWRILKKGGELIILETATPSFFILRWFHRIYFKYAVPFLGWFISQKKQPFFYFKESVMNFMKPVQLIEILQSTGFAQVNYKPLTAGVVGIYKARKN